jgi:hypothetical protein
MIAGSEWRKWHYFKRESETDGHCDRVAICLRRNLQVETMDASRQRPWYPGSNRSRKVQQNIQDGTETIHEKGRSLAKGNTGVTWSFEICCPRRDQQCDDIGDTPSQA